MQILPLPIREYLKESFKIDGTIRSVSNATARELLKTYELNVFQLTDSKRGEFYVGFFKKRGVAPAQDESITAF